MCVCVCVYVRQGYLVVVAVVGARLVVALDGDGHGALGRRDEHVAAPKEQRAGSHQCHPPRVLNAYIYIYI